ncbi:ABC transporter permease [Haloarchaeobius sp. HME9146]|uniref:PhnE/PtxC family ABC transporter permease n=1 Tax=Haloarchaeobius sp. HME9146 TaxID=2978732 RepID=UPI0021BE99E6|nr:ABC transporter permease subunit [Haloarchaeobius sp. HME9146]MCT9094525.1 ABC transporter permease subunit [Haloarchaeobius sp. HME9146]
MSDDRTATDGGTVSGADPRITERLDLIERQQLIRRGLYAGLMLAMLVFTGAGLVYLDFTIAQVVRQGPVFISNLLEFLSPDFYFFTLYSQDMELHGWSALIGSLTHPGSLVEAVLQRDQATSIVGASIVTIVVGATGTIVGFPLALFFGVMGSERVTPFPFNFIFRGTMSTIRAIPAIVWVLFYIPVFGPTPLSAMFAIATDTIGNMGRLFTDELEEVEDGPIEAISSTGADRSQVITFGMLSQVFSSFIAWALYILEINVRIAISLGVVGAGGLGQFIKGQLAQLAFSHAAAGIFMVIVIVISVELFSSRLRSRLRPDEEVSEGFFDRLRGLFDGDKWLGRSA